MLFYISRVIASIDHEYLAAMFSVPTMSTVDESDSTLIVCVNLRTEPPSATISNQVVVSLSTLDGTGNS